MFTAKEKEVFDLYKKAAESTVKIPNNWFATHSSVCSDMRIIFVNNLLSKGYKRADIAFYMQIDKSNVTRMIPKYAFRMKNEKRFAMMDETFKQKVSHLQNK